MTAMTRDWQTSSEQSQLADWWARVVAYCIDSAILIAVVLLLREAVLVQLVGVTFHAASTSFVANVVTAAVAGTIYYAPVMYRTNGRTLGKMLLGIEVASVGNARIGLRVVLWRDVTLKTVVIAALGSLHGPLRTIGLVLAFADVLWPLWDRENRALHDFAARTRVVRWTRPGLAQAPESR